MVVVVVVVVVAVVVVVVGVVVTAVVVVVVVSPEHKVFVADVVIIDTSSISNSAKSSFADGL